jgi:hypothetical protein
VINAAGDGDVDSPTIEGPVERKVQGALPEG